MTPIALRLSLEARGAVYGTHFTFGGLGDDVPGLEVMDGAPYTYRAQGGDTFRKAEYRRHGTIEEACRALEAAALDKMALAHSPQATR